MARVRDLSGNGGRYNVGSPDPAINNDRSRAAYGVVDITLSDTADQITDFVFQGFMVTVGGNVAIIDPDNVTVVIPGCVPGVQYAQRVKRFLSTNTTATGIKGLK